MAYRYRLEDTATGDIVGKYNSLDAAKRDLRSAVGAPCRFRLSDRQTKDVIGWSGTTGGLR